MKILNVLRQTIFPRLVIAILVLLFTGAFSVYIWIDRYVKNNIKMVGQLYPGTAEDALIAYLQDTLNSPHDRTHIAVWTLGQIHAQKALPVLHSFYLNDPKGLSCSGKHHEVLT